MVDAAAEFGWAEKKRQAKSLFAEPLRGPSRDPLRTLTTPVNASCECQLQRVRGRCQRSEEESCVLIGPF